MAVYRFKVYFEDDESVWREIEIKSSQNFEDFHNIIQKAIKFDDAHGASFYVSNDTWRKEKEIRILRSRKALQKGTWMHETKIASLIDDPHQKFLYEFDPEGGNWMLHAELMKILPDSPVEYPRISKSNGNPPAQYKATLPTDVVEEEDEEEEIHEEAGGYVHKVTEHYAEGEDGEEEGPTTLRTKTEAEELGEGADVVEEEEEAAEDFEDEAGFEEEDI